MIEPYNLGIFFAVISMIGYGSYQFFINRCVKSISIISSLILVHSFLIMFTLPLLLFYDFPNIDIKVLLLIFITSFVGAINIPFLYNAIKLGKLSIVIPIANTYSLFTILFSFLLFGQVLKLNQYFFGLIIMLGMFFIVTKRKDLKKLTIDKKDIKPVAYALVFSAGLGLFSVLLSPIESSIGPVHASFFTEFLILIFLIGYFLYDKTNFNMPSSGMWKYVALAGFFQAVGAVFFLFGIRYSNVSITSIIGTANPLITLVVAFTFLKERIEWNQFIGIILTLIGLIGIAV